MTITQALKISRSAPANASPYSITLACGFTPLHLQTFLAGHAQLALPERNVTVIPGLYGDLAGTIEKFADSPSDALAVAIEWQDMDPRLGYRGSGAWGPAAMQDIVANSRRMLDRLSAGITRIGSGARIGVSLPTLSIPPLFHNPGWQSGELELLLDRDLAAFAAELAAQPGVSIVNARRLAEESPADARLDLKSDLTVGLPYTTAHASHLASALARAIAPPAPKKGIISDLDDTLWNGIVGEIGADAVTWDLSSHQQLHGLYQKLLAALAEEGTLVGIASKNEPAVVERVFQRRDILLPSERVFPMEVHWNAKSQSIERILQTWNISADAVIFVDDSPMELAEVAAAHPGIECIRFPKDNPAECLAMFRRLRDACGKARISKEDSLRLESIRQGAAFRDAAEGGSTPEAFLQQANAVIGIDFTPAPGDTRVLELVNKTNQFNLNGIRFTDSDWSRKLSAPGAFVGVISYEDKFGSLGKIAVVQGRSDAGILLIETWVMSCRSFARRIEYQCLRNLFERFGVEEARFEFAATAKNGPLQDFAAALIGEKPDGAFSITRQRFQQVCPALYHDVRTTGD